jgi:uncharacterized protein YdeI (YjbR/CyaY-like superfamily)
MNPSATKSFTAVLEPDRTRLNWVIARIPFDVAKVWTERRGLRVRGEIASVNSKTGGYAFRTSLFSGPGKGRMLMVNKKMLAGAKATVGSQVKISLEPDLEERVATVPPELARALKGDRRLPKWFAKLSYSNRKEVAAWITEPQSAEGRKQRAERMAERLLLTLEGEIDPPPILQAAFLRQPLARQGWEAMTVHQRRCHLLGIFGYQSVESRERRAAKAVEEALRVARRGSRVGG